METAAEKYRKYKNNSQNIKSEPTTAAEKYKKYKENRVLGISDRIQKFNSNVNNYIRKFSMVDGSEYANPEVIKNNSNKNQKLILDQADRIRQDMKAAGIESRTYN